MEHDYESIETLYILQHLAQRTLCLRHKNYWSFTIIEHVKFLYKAYHGT